MHQLVSHPDREPGIPLGIAVALEATGAVLDVRFRLAGPIGHILLPSPARPARRDELWRHTCFELFVRGAGAAYAEVNLAPSTEWAAYRFDDYRAGMAPLAMPDPEIAVSRAADVVELAARLHLPDRPHAIGISAVIEEADGRVSYWALAHPPGAPDFHHADCFALKLPPAG
jgi:hypothetical protein